MDYFTVVFPAGSRLGISVICRSTADPLLGNTLVENVPDPNSYAYNKGIRAGDFVISVNGEYVAHIPHDECVKILRVHLEKQVEIQIQFCRPNHSEWCRIRNDINAIVHEGILQKQSGILKRWNPRYFKVTRETLSYYVDGAMRKKISVSSIKLTKSQGLMSRSSSAFGLIAAGKDMELDAGDDTSASLWKHAIQCARKRAFDRDLPVKYQNRNRNSLPSTVTSTYSDNNNNNNINDGSGVLNTAYLNVGRQNQNEGSVSGYNTNNNNVSSSNSKKTLNANSNVYKNPYWMLLLCKLQTASGPEGAVFLGNVPNPATMDWKQINYTFTLEKEVLEKEAAGS